ncbi:hypothetical protein V7122_02440 [Bacillus sp. JJ1532]|uniref:hypothetical protein n=1 Tax=Bacillus sp. JJ1532 TaxID=3122958 RepID=UPI002FFF7496
MFPRLKDRSFFVNGKYVRVEEVTGGQGCIGFIILLALIIAGFNWISDKVHEWRYSDELYTSSNEQLAWDSFKNYVLTTYEIPKELFDGKYPSLVYTSKLTPNKTEEMESKYWGNGTYQFTTYFNYDSAYGGSIKISVYMIKKGNEWILDRVSYFKREKGQSQIEEKKQQIDRWKEELNISINKNKDEGLINTYIHDINSLQSYVSVYEGLKSKAEKVEEVIE